MFLEELFNLFNASFYRTRIMAGNIDQQYGSRHLCPCSFNLVINSLYILVVEMFQSKQCFRVIFRKRKNTRQFNNNPAGFIHVRAEKLETERRCFLVFRVQHKQRRSNHAVRTLFLQTGNTAKSFVGNIFPETLLAYIGTFELYLSDTLPCTIEYFIGNDIVRHYLAKPVVGSANPPAFSGGHGHDPLKKIVDTGSPANRFFPACVFRNVAADGTGPFACRIGSEHKPLFTGILHGFFSNNTCLNLDNRSGNSLSVVKLKPILVNPPYPVKLFSIDDHTIRTKRNRTPG